MACPRIFSRSVLLVLLPALLLRAQSAQTQSENKTNAELKVGGDVSAPLTLTLGDLKAMPRKTISVVNPHEKQKETYEGVPLDGILHKAGLPEGEQTRGAAMATMSWPRRRMAIVFSL